MALFLAQDPSVAASDSDASDTSAEPLASAVPPQDASKASPADGSQLDKSTSTATGRYGQSRGLSSATRASSGRRHRTPSAAQMQSSPQVTAAQGTPVVPTVSRSISLTSLMTPRINGTGGENQEEDGENKPQEVSPQLNEGRWQLLCSPVVGKRPLDEATPLEEINEQLRTADKTVSCRKKRPKTPKGFSFDIPASLRFPASAFEPAGAETSGPPQVVPEEAVLETDQPVASEMDREEHQHQEVGEEACSATMHTFGGDSDMGDKVEEGCNGDVDMKDAIPETPEPTEPQPEAPVSQLSAVENGAQEADESTATEVTALEQGGEQRRAELTVEEGVRIGEKAAEEEPPGKAFGNILTGVTSFVLMVKKQQPAAPPPAAGKTKGKVKALEVMPFALLQMYSSFLFSPGFILTHENWHARQRTRPARRQRLRLLRGPSGLSLPGSEGSKPGRQHKPEGASRRQQPQLSPQTHLQRHAGPNTGWHRPAPQITPPLERQTRSARPRSLRPDGE